MNPQQVESLKRAAILLGAMLLPGVIAIYPQLLGDAPLDVHAMIRAFAAAVVGGVISRYSEGVYDGRRAATGNVIKGDVTPPEPPVSPAAIFAPPITADTLRGLLETVDVLQEWATPHAPPEPPPATIAHRVVTAPVPLGGDAAVKRSHHARPPVGVPALDVHSDS
jgi:hypothetical protein